MNDETEQILNGKDIVRFIKSQTLKWFGHAKRREHETAINKVMKWRPVETKPREIPRER